MLGRMLQQWKPSVTKTALYQDLEHGCIRISTCLWLKSSTVSLIIRFHYMLFNICSFMTQIELCMILCGLILTFLQTFSGILHCFLESGRDTSRKFPLKRFPRHFIRSSWVVFGNFEYLERHYWDFHPSSLFITLGPHQSLVRILSLTIEVTSTSLFKSEIFYTNYYHCPWAHSLRCTCKTADQSLCNLCTPANLTSTLIVLLSLTIELSSVATLLSWMLQSLLSMQYWCLNLVRCSFLGTSDRYLCRRLGIPLEIKVSNEYIPTCTCFFRSQICHYRHCISLENEIFPHLISILSIIVVADILVVVMEVKYAALFTSSTI